MLRFLKVLVLLAVMCLGIVLALRNAQAVDVNYLLGQTRLSLILIIWVSLVVGFILGAALSVARAAGLRGKLRRTRRRVEKLEKDNKALSNPALKDV